MIIHALALFGGASLALGVAALVAARRAAGTRLFLWLSAAVATWCLAGAGHALATTLDAKLLWSKVQYLGIASVPPLWLLFTAEYAGVSWFAAGSRKLGIPRSAFLWAVPAITVAAAATNELHRALWTSVEITASGATVYSYGWWFWVAVGYSYLLLATGTVLVARLWRQTPAPLRDQCAALLAGAMVPWMGNLLYLGGVTDGFDPTPFAFAASNLLFAWALHRSALFDLVPVARDLVIDSLSDAMIVTDGRRRILDANAAAREIAAAHGAGALKGRGVGRDVDLVFPFLKNTPLETTPVASDVLTGAAEPACFEVRVLPVRAHGRTRAWVMLLRDVTETRRAAADREALQQRFQEQQKRESLSILAAGLAHDFNNLLAGIIGNADLLAMQVRASSGMGSHVGAILLGAQRAADLVSKMLAYAGERHGSPDRVNLDEVTGELLDLLRASAARHCSVAYEGRSAVIVADPTQIRQVAMNLIINAAEAVGDGGRVSVATGTETLTPAALAAMRFGQDAAPGEYAFLEVCDDGVGMDEATLRRLFQPFYTTKPSGHGLGLAAVQGIVLGHRGAMRVTSQPGRGSRFTAWFPLASDQARQPAHDASRESLTGSATLS